MCISGDFEYERKFLVRPNVDYPTDEGSLILQGYPVIGSEYSIRIRLEYPLTCLAEEYADTSQLDVDREWLEWLFRSVDQPSSGLITVKELAGFCGTRYEREMDIVTGVAQSVLLDVWLQNPHGLVVKKRYSHLSTSNDRVHSWEIDVFCGVNWPLVLAECEDSIPVVDLLIPDFCWREVTHDLRFTNTYLAQTPFSSWHNDIDWENEGVVGRFSNDFGTNRFG